MAVMAVDGEPETSLGAAVNQLAQTTLGPRLFTSVDDVGMTKGLVDQQLAQLKGHEVWLQNHDRAMGDLVNELTRLQQQVSRLAAIDPRVSRLENRMDAMAERIEDVDTLFSELTRLQEGVETLEGQVDERINSVVPLANRAMSATVALNSRVPSVEQDVKRLRDTAQVPAKGLLLVRDTSGVGGNYSVMDSLGRPVSGATGSIIGIHLLAPGTYTAVGTNNRSRPVSVRADSARVAVIPGTVGFSIAPAAPGGVSVD